MFYEIFQRYGVVLYFLSSFVKFTSEAVATCPDIPDILNGGMNCGNGFHDMSVCGFHCNNGYTLQPNVQSVVCTADGTVPPYWDTGIPSCTADKCDDIVVENGWVDCNDTSLIYSVCTPSCNAGFMVSSSEPLQCATWRVWVPSEVPTCSKAAAAPITTCGLEPVAPAHGTVSCTDDNNIGSVCTFSCADGFLTTEDSSTCAIRAQDMTGQWSVSSFVCEEAACPDIPDILNGGMYCGDGFTDKSVCGFHCNDGYTLQPNVQSVVCTADGTVPPYWDTGIPSCTEEEIDCGQSPVAPEFGTVSCTNGNKEGSMCTFACNEGYINPPVVTTSTCLKTAPGVGSWDTTPPTCIEEEIDCGESPVAPEFGTVSCTNGNKEGSMCTFACNEGYVNPPVVTTSTCLKTAPGVGSWDTTPPTCIEEEVVCTPHLAAPEHGSMICTDKNKENSRCSFECEKGYLISPVGVVSACSKLGPGKGGWTAVPPSCDAIPIRCEELTPSMFTNQTTFTCNGDVVGSVCDITCHGKTQLHGDRKVICEDKDSNGVGEWSSVPNCFFEACGVLNVEHADTQCNDSNKALSHCTVLCKSGFNPSADDSLQCSLLGKWEGTMPTCAAKNCYPPLDDIFFYTSICGSKPGSSCEVQCSEMSEKPGEIITFMCADPAVGNGAGFWNQSIRSCAGCGRGYTDFLILLDASSNMELPVFVQLRDWSAAIMQKLSPIFELKAAWAGITVASSKELICDPKKSVSSLKIKLEFQEISAALLGKELKSIDHSEGCFHLGSALAEAVTYLISRRRPHATPVLFLLVGGRSTDDTTSAMTLAKASGVKIVLIAVGGDAESIDHMSITGEKESIFYVPEMKLLPTVSLNVVNHLLKIDCPGFSQCGGPIRNGQVTCSQVVSEGEATRFNEVCKIVCDSGKVLIGKPESICGDLDGDGAMEWLSTEPGCKEVFCPEMEKPEKGLMTCTNKNLLLSVCKFWCLPNLFMIGLSEAFCGDPDSDGTGEWNAETPVCVTTLLCDPVLSAPANAKVECSNKNLFGTRCKFECGEGYELEGAGVLRCSTPLPNGKVTWSDKPPTCKACRTMNCQQDLIILMDGSGSIKVEQFLKMKEWILKILSGFKGEIDGGGTQVGLIQYSGVADFMCDSGKVKPKYSIELELGRYSYGEIHQRIMDTGHLRGCTSTGDGITRAVKHFEAMGQPETERVLVVVTDGKSNDDVEGPAKAARAKSIKLIAVGIGKFETSELQAIAGAKKVIDVKSFEKLDSAISAVQAQIRARMAQSDVTGIADSGRTVIFQWNLILLCYIMAMSRTTLL